MLYNYNISLTEDTNLKDLLYINPESTTKKENIIYKEYNNSQKKNIKILLDNPTHIVEPNIIKDTSSYKVDSLYVIKKKHLFPMKFDYQGELILEHSQITNINGKKVFVIILLREEDTGEDDIYLKDATSVDSLLNDLSKKTDNKCLFFKGKTKVDDDYYVLLQGCLVEKGFFANFNDSGKNFTFTENEIITIENTINDNTNNIVFYGEKEGFQEEMKCSRVSILTDSVDYSLFNNINAYASIFFYIIGYFFIFFIIYFYKYFTFTLHKNGKFNPINNYSSDNFNNWDRVNILLPILLFLIINITFLYFNINNINNLSASIILLVLLIILFIYFFYRSFFNNNNDTQISLKFLVFFNRSILFFMIGISLFWGYTVMINDMNYNSKDYRTLHTVVFILAISSIVISMIYIYNFFISSAAPSAAPSADPNADLNAAPSAAPNADPNADPNAAPNAAPSAAPNADPNADLNAAPSAAPNADPNAAPNSAPNII